MGKCNHPACNEEIKNNQYACSEHWNELPTWARENYYRSQSKNSGVKPADAKKEIKELWRGGDDSSSGF